MKIVSLNFSTSGSTIGGASNAAFNLSLEISKSIPHTLCRMWDNDSALLASSGLRVSNFCTFLPPLFLFKSPWSKLFCFSHFKSYLSSNLPDIVHIHNLIPSIHLLHICIFLKLKGVKITLSTHGLYEVFCPRYGFSVIQLFAWYLLVSFPVWLVLLVSDHIFIGYPGQMNEIPLLPNKWLSYSLLPNGANPSFESFTAKDSEIVDLQLQLGINPSLPILLYVGNHTRNKGFDDLIILAKTLNYSFNLVICGRIRDPDVCSNMKYSARSTINVVFTDFLEDDKITALYNISDLLLFPSKSDTLPLCVIDSMSSGVLVVAYSLPGIEYLLGSSYPLLVSNFSSSSFVESVSSWFLMDSKRILELKKYCRDRQNSLFTWGKAAQDSINIYNYVCKANVN